MRDQYLNPQSSDLFKQPVSDSAKSDLLPNSVSAYIKSLYI